MAGAGGRSLEETPTWAVAVVCFVLVLISIIIETLIHLLAKWLQKRHKSALHEALEKIKGELMILGFISLLLTVGQGSISKMCVPESVANSWHPCDRKQEDDKYGYDKSNANRRLLLSYSAASLRRILASGDVSDECAAEGKVSLVSTYGIHQLHIFIFTLAISHILYCVVTYALGRLKMRRWKRWETETTSFEYQFQHDPERFRFARDTTFGRRHLSFWSETPILIWIVCFFRQFVRSIPKVDYLTLRHGFIMIILAVGIKLQWIITKMWLRIQDHGGVIKGNPIVQPADDLFWFGNPGLILFLIHFVLFQLVRIWLKIMLPS